MITAIKRLQSNNFLDKLHGILFYSYSFYIPLITILSIVFWSSMSEILITGLSFSWIYYLVTISGLKDYKQNEKYGHLDRYLAKLNPSSLSILTKDPNEGNNLHFGIGIVIISVVSISITMVMALASIDRPEINSLGIFVLSLYITLLFCLSLFMGGGVINAKKVDEAMLLNFDKINNVTPEEKAEFKDKMKENIQESGFVYVFHVTDFCKQIKNRIDEEIKNNNKIKITSSIENKKIKYKIFLDTN